jgi:hypothetical protein
MKSSQDSLNKGSPVSASLTGVQIQAGITAGGGHTWAPTFLGHALTYCKGASLLTGGTTGVLAVHLTDDPASVWYLVDLYPGAGIFACDFDLVGDSTLGTTVALDAKLYIYPGQYANVSDVND